MGSKNGTEENKLIQGWIWRKLKNKHQFSVIWYAIFSHNLLHSVLENNAQVGSYVLYVGYRETITN